MKSILSALVLGLAALGRADDDACVVVYSYATVTVDESATTSSALAEAATSIASSAPAVDVTSSAAAVSTAVVSSASAAGSVAADSSVPVSTAATISDAAGSDAAGSAAIDSSAATSVAATTSAAAVTSAAATTSAADASAAASSAASADESDTSVCSVDLTVAASSSATATDAAATAVVQTTSTLASSSQTTMKTVVVSSSTAADSSVVAEALSTSSTASTAAVSTTAVAASSSSSTVSSATASGSTASTTGVITGEATFYGGNLAGGACMFTNYTLPSSMYGTAYSGDVWDNAAECGRCVSVTGPNGNSITAMVVDECPECAQDHLDLFQDAFEAIGDISAGIISISYEFVDCGITTPIVLHSKTGTSAYWFSVEVVNSNIGIESLEVSTDSGSTWTSTTRSEYNFFEYSSGFGTETVDVRITSIEGTTIDVDSVSCASDAETTATSNFS